jgi:hypothetical protein
MSPGDIKLAGDPGPGRPGRKFFVGCPECKWLEARTDAVATCESGQHLARRMEVKYACKVCRWVEWCKGPVECNVSKSHKLTPEGVRPIQ